VITNADRAGGDGRDPFAERFRRPLQFRAHGRPTNRFQAEDK
jgi:hypothetical protein